MGCVFACLFAHLHAGPLQRIGHLELPLIAGNKGLYAAGIDSANGYAYFIGSYIFKLDITGSLPVQVGPAVSSGQFIECDIDPAAGYLYLPKNGTINRYSLGAGNAAVTSAGSYFINANTTSSSLVIDDSDPNPANHYGYFMYSGTPATVYKIALSTMTVVSSLPLNSGENNFAFGTIDTKNGYAYFGAWSIYTNPTIPQVIKIKLTPGTNAPIRIGIANLDTVVQSLWAHSIDTVHGYLYFGTDNGTTNPDTVYKVQLGTGDVAPTPVGSIQLHTGEFQLTSSVIDPVGGYVYFGNDNTYPGRVFQILLNGPNPPVEIGYLQLQGGTSTPPPDGTSSSNTAGNGVPLPYGEVYLRSAVYDPVRGYAYFGQDSGPNQVVKVQLARDVPVITSTAKLPDTSFQLHFTHTPFVTSTAWATTDLTQPLSSWTPLGATTEVTPGQFMFNDPQAGSFPRRFYVITSP
jgi:hypothetical protein